MNAGDVVLFVSHRTFCKLVFSNLCVDSASALVCGLFVLVGFDITFLCAESRSWLYDRGGNFGRFWCHNRVIDFEMFSVRKFCWLFGVRDDIDLYLSSVLLFEYFPAGVHWGGLVGFMDDVLVTLRLCVDFLRRDLIDTVCATELWLSRFLWILDVYDCVISLRGVLLLDSVLRCLELDIVGIRPLLKFMDGRVSGDLKWTES